VIDVEGGLVTLERFPVEAGHIMVFARAIGDPNPVYADPTSPEATELGGAIAPPTFVMAGAQFDPDNSLIPKPGEPWFGSGREPSGAARKGTGRLHAEQHFEFHRPLRAGEVLTTRERSGGTWAKESRRGGTLTFEEKVTDYLNVDTGEVVVTSRFVTALRT
jgi:acyl dehydratase